MNQPLSRGLFSRMQSGDKFALYGDFEPTPYNFYTGIVPITVLEKEEALSRFLSSQERVFCLLRFRDFLKFQTAEDHADFQLVLRRRVGDGEFVLISNQ